MPDHPASPAPRPRSNRTRNLVLAVLGAAVALWLARFGWHAWHYESTDDAYIAGHIHQVSSQIDGQAVEVLVRENEAVQAGQVLVRLDPAQTDIALARARAETAQAAARSAQAEADAQQARSRQAEARAGLAPAGAELDQAQAQARLARITLDRDQRLSSGDARAIAPAEYDTAHATSDAADAAVAAARANQESRRAAAASAGSELKAAEAARQAAAAGAQAAVAAEKDAERRRGYAEIRAPAAGRIGAKNVEVGNRVQTGETLLVLVEPQVWVEGNFKETQLARMHPGQRAEVSVDALGGRTFAGHLDSFAPASGAEFALLPADNATGNFTKVVQRVPVRILFDPGAAEAAQGALLPGLSVTAEVRVR
jgi:membrane fusion protein (multidrug efflux system)